MELQEKEFFMREALKEAQKAYDQEEVPIGAVVVLNGEIIGRGHNLREKEQDATLHAEIKAIRQANQHLGSWRLEDCELFVTLEPCPMCSGAMILARMKKVVFGAFDPKAGDIGRRIGSEQGGGLVMPRDPIAVFGVDELGIGMNGFSGRSDQHSFGNVGLVGLNLHDGYL